MLLDKNKLPLVALESMNKTHFEEVEIVNAIYTLLNKETPKNEIIQGLQEFLDHTINHFSNEETMMQEHGFFAYECHKSAHDTALLRIRELVQNFEANNDIDALKNYFDTELVSWLSNHISTMDTVTAQFLSNAME